MFLKVLLPSESSRMRVLILPGVPTPGGRRTAVAHCRDNAFLGLLETQVAPILWERPGSGLQQRLRGDLSYVIYNVCTS